MIYQTQTIPLFPLDVVLFPGMVMPLHIFEPRYRKMVEDCVSSGTPFGVIWAESEPLEIPSDVPLVGTKAVLTNVVALPDGRFNIETVGSERFRVRSLSYEEPYLTGHIESFPEVELDNEATRQAVRRLRPLLERYLGLLSEAVGQQVTVEPLPDEPETLAFVTAIIYQCSNLRKQQLLSIESIADLLNEESELLAVENAIVERSLALRSQDEVAPLLGGAVAVYGLN